MKELIENFSKMVGRAGLQHMKLHVLNLLLIYQTIHDSHTIK